jgi:3-dehydroquinate synthase
VVEVVVAGVTEVLIGRDVLGVDPVLGDARPKLAAIVTQPGALGVAGAVAGHLGEAGIRTLTLEVPDGGAAKTLDTVGTVCRSLSEAGATRSDLVVGVGGGAVTDLAGFVAAVYLRGVRVHLVATTLLAAVDAAIGGKTGIDVGGKNLVGVFRHPARVVVDLDVLDTLPLQLRRHGLAEALKAGLVGDPLLFEILETGGIDADLAEVVSRSVAVKARIVGRDFEESGERAHLNYGHTVGHALESVGGLPHGEAIAVGMVAAARASAIEAGFVDEGRQKEAIAGLGLPVVAPSLDRDRVIAQIQLDKKRDATGLRMVLLEAIGGPRVAHIASTTVDAALRAVGIPGGES